LSAVEDGAEDGGEGWRFFGIGRDPTGGSNRAADPAPPGGSSSSSTRARCPPSLLRGEDKGNAGLPPGGARTRRSTDIRRIDTVRGNSEILFQSRLLQNVFPQPDRRRPEPVARIQFAAVVSVSPSVRGHCSSIVCRDATALRQERSTSRGWLKPPTASMLM
jgi:hypothetical protein